MNFLCTMGEQDRVNVIDKEQTANEESSKPCALELVKYLTSCLLLWYNKPNDRGDFPWFGLF